MPAATAKKIIDQLLARVLPSRRLALRQAAVWSELAGRWRSDEPASVEIGRIYDCRTPGRDVRL